jgi:restriction system protein
LVESVSIIWKELLRLFQADPNSMYQIDPRKWEEIIASSYKAIGFDEVTLTPRSGDYGRDVIVVKHGFGAVRFLDQVKAFAPDHKVTANDVRALLGVLAADRAASKGIVTTTSDFAPRIKDDPYIKPYLPTRLELVNGTDLIQRLSELDK